MSKTVKALHPRAIARAKALEIFKKEYPGSNPGIMVCEIDHFIIAANDIDAYPTWLLYYRNYNSDEGTWNI